MIRTNDPGRALEFCAQATRLGLGLEVTAEGSGVYALATRDRDEGVALWWLLGSRDPGSIRYLDLQEMIDQYAERAADHPTTALLREHPEWVAELQQDAALANACLSWEDLRAVRAGRAARRRDREAGRA